MGDKMKKKINCTVHSCMYNACDKCMCKLNEIKIDNQNNEATSKKETICDSYVKKIEK